MTKDDLLDLIVSEAKERLRQPGDITLSDFRKKFRESAGIRLGEKRGRHILDTEVESGRLIRLIVMDGHTGKDVTIWRAAKKKAK